MFAIGIWLLAAARYRDRVSEAMTELDESGAESNPAPRPAHTAPANESSIVAALREQLRAHLAIWMQRRAVA